MSYDPLPVSWYDSPEMARATVRANWHSGSPHTIQSLACAGCGADLGIYYGRIDRIPEQPQCGECAVSVESAEKEEKDSTKGD